MIHLSILKHPLLLLCLLLLLPLQAQAHKIHVFAWTSGNTVTVESNFSGNKPLIDGAVSVLNNQSKAVLLKGTGDKKGVFSFQIPALAREKAMDLLIVVSGSEGHQAQWLLPADEYLSASPSPAAQIVPAPVIATASNEELREIIQELLIQELAPIKRSLAAAEKKKPGFRDIMGGIGYLLGLAGLVAWLRTRPAKDSSQQ